MAPRFASPTAKAMGNPPLKIRKTRKCDRARLGQVSRAYVIGLHGDLRQWRLHTSWSSSADR